MGGTPKTLFRRESRLLSSSWVPFAPPPPPQTHPPPPGGPFPAPPTSPISGPKTCLFAKPVTKGNDRQGGPRHGRLAAGEGLGAERGGREALGGREGGFSPGRAGRAVAGGGWGGWSSPEEPTRQGWKMDVTVTVGKDKAASGLTPGAETGLREPGLRGGGTPPGSESLAEAGMQASRGGESPWRRKGKIRTGRGRTDGEGSHMGAWQTRKAGWHCPCWPRGLFRGPGAGGAKGRGVGPGADPGSRGPPSSHNGRCPARLPSTGTVMPSHGTRPALPPPAASADRVFLCWGLPSSKLLAVTPGPSDCLSPGLLPFTPIVCGQHGRLSAADLVLLKHLPWLPTTIGSKPTVPGLRPPA